MWFSSDHMVVTTTGFCFSTQQRSALASLLTARTPAGSVAAVLAPPFVAHSRFARAQSKRRSGLNPAVRGDGGRDFDPQREQGGRAGLSKRDLPSTRPPASSRALHAGRSLSWCVVFDCSGIKRGKPTHLRRRPGAPPATPRPGSFPVMGAEQRVPSAGIARPPAPS